MRKKWTKILSDIFNLTHKKWINTLDFRQKWPRKVMLFHEYCSTHWRCLCVILFSVVFPSITLGGFLSSDSCLRSRSVFQSQKMSKRGYLFCVRMSPFDTKGLPSGASASCRFCNVDTALFFRLFLRGAVGARGENRHMSGFAIRLWTSCFSIFVCHILCWF